MLFNKLQEILQQEHAEVLTVSEMHGMICGILIADFSFSFENWLGEMAYLEYFDPKLMQDDDMLVLKNFFTETADQLKAGDLSFQMLLPGNEADYRERIVALSKWCSGFIYGFGLQDKVDDKALSEDAKALFAQISEIDSFGITVLNEDDLSEDEAAYRKIKKFVSMEVLLLSDEIQNDAVRRREH